MTRFKYMRKVVLESLIEIKELIELSENVRMIGMKKSNNILVHMYEDQDIIIYAF